MQSWYSTRSMPVAALPGRKIRLVTLDDAYDPSARGGQHARELIDDNKVLALFQYAGTPPAMAAISDRRGKSRCPSLPPFTGSDALRQKSNRYVFNIKASYGDELAAMVRQLAAVGIERVAVVYLNNAFGTGGLAMVERRRPPTAVKLLAKEPLEVDGSHMDQGCGARSRGAAAGHHCGQSANPVWTLWTPTSKRGTAPPSTCCPSSATRSWCGAARPFAWHRHPPGCATAVGRTIGVARELRPRPPGGCAGADLCADGRVSVGQIPGGRPAPCRQSANARKPGAGAGVAGQARPGRYPSRLSRAQHNTGKYVDLMILGGRWALQALRAATHSDGAAAPCYHRAPVRCRLRDPSAGVGRTENREDGANPSRAQRCKDDAPHVCHWLPSREGVIRADDSKPEDRPELSLVPQGRAVPSIFTHRGLP